MGNKINEGCLEKLGGKKLTYIRIEWEKSKEQYYNVKTFAQL